jgi:hypothetical protein
MQSAITSKAAMMQILKITMQVRTNLAKLQSELLKMEIAQVGET